MWIYCLIAVYVVLHIIIWKGHGSRNYALLRCKECGLKTDRDLNASKNILKRALDSASPNLDSKTVKATEGHSGGHASGESARPQMGAVLEELRTDKTHPLRDAMIA